MSQYSFGAKMQLLLGNDRLKLPLLLPEKRRELIHPVPPPQSCWPSSVGQILLFSSLNQTSTAPCLLDKVRDLLFPLQQPVISASQGSQASHHCPARAGKMLCNSSLLVQAQQAARFILQASHSALSNLITRCWAFYSRFLSTYKMKARNHLLQATWTTFFVAVCCAHPVV